ncbi:G protein alpha subunit f [Arctopsyche grandis]|uniref:G protein alpha subunit f n=1 Tax=Arctopsyche grandis TaxID=121162 RepID=UPI00406D83F9
MKCFGSSVSSEDKENSKQIDKQIKKWYKKYDQAIKVLLLGAGEAGKTTILKQMKILHINGFSEEEKLERAGQIKKNIHEAAGELSRQLSILGLQPGEKASNAALYFINGGAPNFDQEYFNIVNDLWMDSAVKECLRRSNEYQLIDSAEYFLNKLDVVRKPNYKPDEQDILNCRQRTTGIQKIEFKAKGKASSRSEGESFWMYDVGGQRGERKKWLQVFEGIHAVWFIVAASDFDQTLREDNAQNRLRESISLFGDVWNSRFLIKAGLIVFLNKQDILERKVREGRQIAKYFPEYNNYRSKNPSSNDEYTKVKEFIKNLLVQVTQKHAASQRASTSRQDLKLENSRARQCYYHFTVATNTDNIKTIFDDIHNLILRNNVIDMGIA